MLANSFKLSEFVAKNASLWDGDGKNVTVEIADTDLTTQAAWLVIKGTSGKAVKWVYDRDNQKREFTAILRMLTHSANGDYDEWTHDRHLVLHPVSLPAGLGQLINKVEILKPSSEGWKTETKRGLMDANGRDFMRADFHDRINDLIDGHTVLVIVPGYLGQNYIREVLNTLRLGRGSALEAMQDKIEEAMEERALYQARKPLVQNGRGAEVGVTEQPAKGKRLLVKTTDKGTMNLYEQADNVRLGVYTIDNTEIPQYDQEWDATDELLVDSWQTISQSRYLLVGPATK